MPRHRVHRCTTALLLVLSLLFSQLALARYVCPGGADPVAMAAMMAAGEPCHGMDEAQPVLCHQHAAGAAQTFDHAKPLAAALPVLLWVMTLPLPAPATGTDAAPAAAAATAEARPPPSPLFLATLRLRV